MKTYTLKLNSHGQVTIPSSVRQKFGIKPNDKVELVFDGKNLKVKKAEKYTIDDLPKVIGKTKKISEEDLEKAISQAFKPSNI